MDDSCAGCIYLLASNSSSSPSLHNYPYCGRTGLNLSLILERFETCKTLNQKITYDQQAILETEMTRYEHSI